MTNKQGKEVVGEDGIVRVFKSTTEITNFKASQKIKSYKLSDESIEAGTGGDHADDYPQRLRNNCIFRMEYDYWRNNGQAHIVAHRKAIDYYRKHTSREVTENWIAKADNHEQSHQIEEATERIQFNDIVRLILSELTDRQLEFFCYIIVQQDLDQQLDDDLFKIVITNTHGNRPEEVKDIANFMGLKLSKTNVCTTLTMSRNRIKAIFVKYGLTPKLLGLG
jgi:hypothetical protein